MKFPFIVVLDINNTLLSKIKREDKDTLNKLNNSLLFGIPHYFLLKRSFTDLFIRFLESHDLKYVIWSTALKKNIKKMAVYLKDLGYKFDGFFGQEDCEEGEYPGMKTKKYVKKLEIISKEFKTPLENCILVDDSYQKSVKGQNFLKIKEIDLFQEDEELIRIGFEIDKFIKCKKDCEIKDKWFEVSLGRNEEWGKG